MTQDMQVYFLSLAVFALTSTLCGVLVAWRLDKWNQRKWNPRLRRRKR